MWAPITSEVNGARHGPSRSRGGDVALVVDVAELSDVEVARVELVEQGLTVLFHRPIEHDVVLQDEDPVMAGRPRPLEHRQVGEEATAHAPPS